jgi:hypothetical protein
MLSSDAQDEDGEVVARGSFAVLEDDIPHPFGDGLGLEPRAGGTQEVRQPLLAKKEPSGPRASTTPSV